MIDGVSVNNDNLVINAGGVTKPSPPPSSPEISRSASGQAAVEVDLSTQVARDSNKKSERVDKSQSEQSPEKELKESIDKLNEILEKMDREILFKLDKKIDKHYISVIDKTSQEVIREFPPKEIRTFIARFDEFNEKLNTSSDIKSLIINLEV
jgi:flagellar protein FlaG